MINETEVYKECCNGKKKFWSKSRFRSQLSAITSFVSSGTGVPNLSSVCQIQMALILPSNYSVPIFQKRSLEALKSYIFLKLFSSMMERWKACENESVLFLNGKLVI